MDQRWSKQRDGRKAVCRRGTKRWHPNTSALEASRDEDDIHLQQVRYASLSLSLSRVQDFDFYHSLSFFRYARYPNRTKSKQRQLNRRDDVGTVREPVLFGVAQNSR